MIVLPAAARAGESQDRTISGAVFGGGLAAVLSRGPHQIARPQELLARGSWTSENLATLSARGELDLDPDYIRSQGLLTRGDAARLLAATLRRLAGTLPGPALPVRPVPAVAPQPPPPAIPGPPDTTATGEVIGPNDLVLPGGRVLHRPSPPTASASLAAVLRGNPRLWLLVWEFRPELELQGVGIPADLRPTDTRLLLAGFSREQADLAGGRPHLDELTTGSVDGAWHGLHFTASASDENPGGFDRPFHLSSIGNGPITTARPMLQYDARQRLVRGISRLAAWDEFAGWRLEVGRDWLQWGSAYSGSLILSDNAGPLDLFLASKSFNVGRLGTWRFHQFLAYDPEPGTERTLLGRRIEKTLSPGWEGAVTETLVSQGIPPPLSLVVPIYLVTGKGGETADNRQNYLIDFQTSYTDTGGRRLYGDILFDDIVFPIPFPHQFAPPRKAGFLGGVNLPFGSGHLVLEAVYTDATLKSTDTYLHRNPLIAYARYGQIIGNPVGPGSSGIVARADLFPRSGWRSWVQATVEQHHREFPHPDMEAAAWFGVDRRWHTGPGVGLTIRPYYVQNEDTAWGRNHIRLDGQVYFSLPL